jgi:hypothetical protein
MGAAVVLCVEDDSLTGGGKPFGVIKPDGFAVTENGEVVVGVAGQPDHIGHGQKSAPAREAVSGCGFEVFECSGDDDGRG